MRGLIATTMVILAVTGVVAQSIEDWIESAPEPMDAQSYWDDLRKNPIDLNCVSVRELAALPFFDFVIAGKIIDLREKRGGFVGIEDIGAIAELTALQREVLCELTTIKEKRIVVTDISVLGNARARGGAMITGEWTSRLQARFRGADRSGYFRGVHQPYDPQLLDETSLGIEFVRRPGNVRILLGDFLHETGTGLVFAAPFGTAHWLASREAMGPGRARGAELRPSSNKRFQYRGIAIEAARDPLEATIFGGWTRRDAAISDSGILRLTEGEPISSQELGEAREGKAEERLIGGRLQFIGDELLVGGTGYTARYSDHFTSTATSSLPSVNGNRLTAGSFFASAHTQRIHLWGEYAKSDPGGTAYQGVVSVRLQRFGFSAYHSHADVDYFAPHSSQWDGFDEAARNCEVTGVRLQRIWMANSLSGTIRTTRTPYRTETSVLRKQSSSVEAQWRTSPAPALETILRLSRSWSEDDADDLLKDGLRAEMGFGSGKREVRARGELRTTKRSSRADRSMGSLLFLQAKFTCSHVDLFSRITVFHTDDYDAAIPLYENALRGEYPLVNLSGSGRRLSLIVSRDWLDFKTALRCSHVQIWDGQNDQSGYGISAEFSYHR